MWLVARLGQLDLFLPLTRSGAGLLTKGIPAVRATDAGDVMFGKTIRCGNGDATSVALIEIALAEVMPDGYAVIENKAVTLPARLFLRNLLKVFENSTLEVKHLLKALAEHVTGSLLAANPAGAEHRHFLVLLRIEMRLDVVGKLAKRSGLRVDSPFE